MQAKHPAARTTCRRTGSPAVTGFAAEMLGFENSDNDDVLAEQWLIRVFVVLWCWPLKDAAAERAMLQRFLGPPNGVDRAGAAVLHLPARMPN